MSYNDYLKAIELIEKNKHLLLIPIYPQEEKDIQKVEDLLNVELPNSFRNFLNKYGNLSFGAEDIYGLDDRENYETDHRYTNIVCNTLDERKFDYDTPFPQSFVVIYDLGNGEKFCLDTSEVNEEGECPLMAWCFGRIESLKDDVGEDFGDFLLNFIVKPALDSAEKGGKTVNH